MSQESSLKLRSARFTASLRLRVENLTLARGGRTILSGLDLALASGEALSVTGANGAGKSTLLRALAGLLRPASGEISLEGAEGGDIAPHAHYIGHSDALKAALTARENLDFWAAMLGGGGASPADALAGLGLAATLDLPVAILSAGQKRRVALARLLVAPRPLWLLDEPTTGLDAGARDALSALMREHLKQGGLIVAATHTPLDVPARSLQLGVSA